MADPEFENGFSDPLPNRLELAPGLTLERLYPDLEDDQDLDAFVDRNRDFLREFVPVYADKLNSPDDAKRLLKGALAHAVAIWGLRVEAVPRYLGGIFTLAPEADGSYDLSYALDKNAQGRGFATRGVNSLTSQAFQRGSPKITAKVDPANSRSLKVMQRTGFRQVGVDAKGNLDFELLPPS